MRQRTTFLMKINPASLFFSLKLSPNSFSCSSCSKHDSCLAILSIIFHLCCFLDTKPQLPFLNFLKTGGTSFPLLNFWHSRHINMSSEAIQHSDSAFRSSFLSLTFNAFASFDASWVIVSSESVISLELLNCLFKSSTDSLSELSSSPILNSTCSSTASEMKDNYAHGLGRFLAQSITNSLEWW